MKLKNIVYTVGCVFLLASCSDSFLNKEPQNGTLLEDQYMNLDDGLAGSTRAIYSLLYEYGGHDSFGQRSLDMYGDFTSGDMAMSTQYYGWFSTDDQGLAYAYRAADIWYYYYRIIRLSNLVINAIEKTEADSEVEGKAPSLPVESGSNVTNGFYYGQVLALRGWAYAGLMRYFVSPTDLITNLDNELTVPIYTEVETAQEDILGAPRATARELFDRIESDLTLGVEYLDAYQKAGAARESKLEMNADVARATLAYAYINMGDTASYRKALAVAKKVIDDNNFTILPNSKLLTTGFADVSEDSWMWGQDVTVETSTALGSFFGQVDLHTYSYAAAGDIKGIDDGLYAQIEAMGWDGRVNWFNKNKKYAPEGKFYNVSTKDTYDLNEVDRNWLNDNVFMRIESVYLIAAEAALKQTTPDLAASLNYLDAIMLQRLIDENDADVKTLYNDYKATLTTADALLDAIIYNWRVEMWGEGYGMQTVRRLTHTQTLGNNHFGSRKGATVDYTTIQFTWRIPSSETRYNPYIADDELTEATE